MPNKLTHTEQVTSQIWQLWSALTRNVPVLEQHKIAVEMVNRFTAIKEEAEKYVKPVDSE